MTCGQIAMSDEPVLLQGETGTGKEVFARKLHSQSRRVGKPFLTLNCVALPSELIESELFGYERGAFTGAFARKPGLFELADGGTILLDEIGDMPLGVQAKLLQVVQDGGFRRLGGRGTAHVNVRIISATHRDLEACARNGTFREDLFYRLNVLSVYLPPLRERTEDVLPLARFLLERHASQGDISGLLTPELQRAMLAHSWPGNIRELENLMRRLAALRDPDRVSKYLIAEIGRTRMPPTSEHLLRPVMPGPIAAPRSNRTDEVAAMLNALNYTRWNRRKAAALLNINYKALLYRMRKLGIDGGSGACASVSEEDRRASVVRQAD